MALPECCPLCQSPATDQEVVTAHVYGAKGTDRAFFHCSSCDVRYMYPGLTPAETDRFYAAEFEGFMAGRAGASGGWSKAEDHIRANEPNRARRMSYLEPYLRSRASILEVVAALPVHASAVRRRRPRLCRNRAIGRVQRVLEESWAQRAPLARRAVGGAVKVRHRDALFRARASRSLRVFSSGSWLCSHPAAN